MFEGVSFLIFILEMKYQNISFHCFLTLINNFVELIEIIIRHSYILWNTIFSKVNAKCGQNCSLQKGIWSAEK